MYNKEFEGDVCSHSQSFMLDNFIRKIFQNPKKIIGEYVKNKDTVIDLGCGPGFFSIEMAKIVGSEGRVFAVDLQKQMLKKLEKKATTKNLNKQIILHNCSQKKIGLKNDIKANFILAFYMVHETPDHKTFLEEVKTMLKKGGRFLIVEPRFHVKKQHFQEIIQDIKDIGFKIIDTPARKGGRSLLVTV